MTSPPGGEGLGTNAVRVLVYVARSTRPPLYPDLMGALGLTRRQVYVSLHQLRARGLVTWETGKTGTLRALVAEVPLSEGRAA